MHLLDTNVIIDYLRGDRKALNYLQESITPLICVVSQGEIYQGAKNKEELRKLEQILKKFTVIPITPEISHMAIEFLKLYHLPHGLLILDSLIAATAIENKLTLVTGNVKHFIFIKDLKIKDWKELEG